MSLPNNTVTQVVAGVTLVGAAAVNTPTGELLENDQDLDSRVSAAAASVVTHAALTSPHSAASAATPSRLVVRDSSGRAQFAAPSASADAATKQTVDDHAALTSPHSATSAATASRLVVRDSSGRAQFATPSASADAATKGYVDAAVTKFLSAAFSYSSLIYNAFAHGLGAVPSDVKILAKCLSSDLGYSAGDWVYGIIQDDNSNLGAATPGADSSYVFFRWPTRPPRVCRKDTGVMTAISAANWEFYLSATK